MVLTGGGPLTESWQECTPWIMQGGPSYGSWVFPPSRVLWQARVHRLALFHAGLSPRDS